MHVIISIASAGGRLKSGEAVKADFVVDASGRGSQLPQWLEGIRVLRGVWLLHVWTQH